MAKRSKLEHDGKSIGERNSAQLEVVIDCLDGTPATHALILEGEAATQGRFLPSEIREILKALACYEVGLDIAIRWARASKKEYRRCCVESCLREISSSFLSHPVLFRVLDGVLSGRIKITIHEMIDQIIAMRIEVSDAVGFARNALKSGEVFSDFWKDVWKRGISCRMEQGTHRKKVLLCLAVADGANTREARFEALTSCRISPRLVTFERSKEGDLIPVASEKESLEKLWKSISGRAPMVRGFTAQMFGLSPVGEIEGWACNEDRGPLPDSGFLNCMKSTRVVLSNPQKSAGKTSTVPRKSAKPRKSGKPF